jgi:hypothetical protein
MKIRIVPLSNANVVPRHKVFNAHGTVHANVSCRLSVRSGQFTLHPWIGTAVHTFMILPHYNGCYPDAITKNAWPTLMEPASGSSTCFSKYEFGMKYEGIVSVRYSRLGQLRIA